MPPRKEVDGTVYIAGNVDKGLYRIGWTHDHLDVRICQMHRNNAFPVMEIASSWVKNASQVETQLKDRFRLKRVLGGWFLLNEQDIKFARRFLGIDFL